MLDVDGVGIGIEALSAGTFGDVGLTGGGEAAQALGRAVSVTHFVSQLAVGIALILLVLMLIGGISVVGTADQLHMVPEADAEEARTVHVDGVGAPEESGIQHWA